MTDRLLQIGEVAERVDALPEQLSRAESFAEQPRRETKRARPAPSRG